MRYLKLAYSNTSGRNNTGRITSFHRGGGYFKKYRMINWGPMLRNVYAYVIKREYDPFRKAPIDLIYYENGFYSYHIGINGLKLGFSLLGGRFVPLFLGNSLPLFRMPVCSFVSQVDSKYGRSAGTRCQILKHVGNRTVIKLPSGEKKIVLSKKWGRYGRIGRVYSRFEKVLKAGDIRKKGWRPVVRGVAMNPIDHPHGGGEGKTSGGRPSVSPWGKKTK
jgi:large subunit ribosomal protein L2